MKNKYSALERSLLKETADRVAKRFDEIERLIGEKLPSSAYQHRAWWANQVRGHSHAKAWLNANYQAAEVDMEGKKLMFVRKGRASDEAPRRPSAVGKGEGRHPAIGALKGLITIEAGYDLTLPAMPEWADDLDAKYGPEKHR